MSIVNSYKENIQNNLPNKRLDTIVQFKIIDVNRFNLPANRIGFTKETDIILFT